MQHIRVDFYLLESGEENERFILACRVLEKAYTKGHRVFVYCKDEQQAFYMDELLWTFKEDSFVPHHLQGEGPMPPPPIQIGFDGVPKGFNDILLNLSGEIPSFYKQFKRIIEIVGSSEEEKAQSRPLYLAYKQAGTTLHAHKIVNEAPQGGE